MFRFVRNYLVRRNAMKALCKTKTHTIRDSLNGMIQEKLDGVWADIIVFKNKKVRITIRPKPWYFPQWFYNYIIERTVVVEDVEKLGYFITFQRYRSLAQQAKDEELFNLICAD